MNISLRTELLLAVVSYSFCSGSLVLVNKLILHFLPYPSLVIGFQLLATLAFIATANILNFLEVDPIRWKTLVPYLAYTIGFSLGVYCNMRSLAVSNVETVIVFRALAPAVVSVLDALCLGRMWPSVRSWSALALIVLGAFGYARTDEQFITQGWMAYMWPTAYLLVISFEMAYGKKIISSVDLKTRSGPVVYTNLLGFPPMLLFAAMGNEYTKFWNDYWSRDEYRLPPLGIGLLLLGCVVGTSIGYSSWWCREKVSAASFTLIGVMNKCLTIIVNLCIWDQHASPTGIAFLLLCLFGGSMYRQAPLRKDVEPEYINNEDEDSIDEEAISLVQATSDEDGTKHS